MKLLKLVNAPTKFYISGDARKNCRLLYGDDLAALMMESVQNFEPRAVHKDPKTFMSKLLNKIRPKKEMSIGVLSNKDGDFFVQSRLKIGNFDFLSEPHRFNFLETIETLKNFRKVVQQTRDDILKQLETFNRNKRFFKF